MANLTFIINASLDGYFQDSSGDFGFTEPSEEVHAFFNELDGRHGTYLLGRRMYETLAFWEGEDLFSDENEADPSYAEVARGYGEVWKSRDKVVYSRTLKEPTTKRTRIVSEFDPEEVRRMKESADTDLTVGGPELAAEALRAGLVDEYHVVVAPVVLGAGKPVIPADLRLELDLLDERRFESGSVHLRYAVLYK